METLKEIPKRLNKKKFRLKRINKIKREGARFYGFIGYYYTGKDKKPLFSGLERFRESTEEDIRREKVKLYYNSKQDKVKFLKKNGHKKIRRMYKKLIVKNPEELSGIKGHYNSKYYNYFYEIL